MGVIRWLNRVDPAVWGRACDRLVSAPPKTGTEAEQFLKSFGRLPDPYLISGFEDLREEPDLESTILNGLLEAATKEESWELDKSLSHGFEQLPGWIAELRPFRAIIDFSGLGVQPPSSCVPDDGSGLFGCLSPEALAACVSALERFPTIGEVVAALRAARPGAVARLFGASQRQSALAAKLKNEYFAMHWENLRTALVETSRRDHFLGLGMSV